MTKFKSQDLHIIRINIKKLVGVVTLPPSFLSSKNFQFMYQKRNFLYYFAHYECHLWPWLVGTIIMINDQDPNYSSQNHFLIPHGGVSGNCCWGSFNNYVDIIFPFFERLPPTAWTFSSLKVEKMGILWTHLILSS